MRLLRVLIALLALGGLVDSVLALRIHNQDPALAPPCAVSAHWDCGAVNHSRYAVFPPIAFDEAPGAKPHMPVAIGGIAGYGLIAILALWAPMWLVLTLAEIGFACAAILSYLEAYVMEKWCIYCVWSQGLITAIVIVSVVTLVLENRRRRRTSAVVVAG